VEGDLARFAVRDAMKTIPWTELPEDKSGRPNSTEWNFYRREVGRLLAEGHEGKWVLIKGEEIIGMWDREDVAFAAARERYLFQPCLVKQVLVAEPLLRVSLRVYQCLK
jgi:hypothetical protein